MTSLFLNDLIDFSNRFFETLIENSKCFGAYMHFLKNPMNKIWYYVETYNDYFPFVQHREDGLVLDGTHCFGGQFVVRPSECRLATYEEVRAFHNP